MARAPDDGATTVGSAAAASVAAAVAAAVGGDLPIEREPTLHESPPRGTGTHQLPLSLDDQRALYLAQGLALCTVVIQAVNLLNNRSSAATEAAKTQTLLVLAATSLTAAVTLGAQLFYWRHRVVLLPLLRITTYSIPSVRSTGVGTALLLERLPTPGVRGALIDALRTGSGTKAAYMSSLVGLKPLPPTAALLTSIAMTALSWNYRGERSYCATPVRRSLHPSSVYARAGAGMPHLQPRPIAVCASALQADQPPHLPSRRCRSCCGRR